MKRVLAVREISGHPEALAEQAVNRQSALAKNTLGQLVSEFGSNFIKPESSTKADAEIANDAALDRSDLHIAINYVVEIADEEYLKSKADHSQLVSLRNDLVHHFVEKFDLSTESGCVSAATYLDEASQTIRRHHLELVAMASAMDDARKFTASFMSSDAGKNFFGYGISPNGDVSWPSTPIVCWLKLAEKNCGENGWTSLAKAILFIQANNPDLTPKKYNCSSWREVIYRSGAFVIEKRKDAASNAGQVWYRSKPANG